MTATTKLSKSQIALAGFGNPAKSGGFANPPGAFRDLLNLLIY
jgi:hypothetical protein